VPVARLVAEAFVDVPPPFGGSVSDTVIFKDFNQDNWDPDNLAWRSRWFALEYHTLPKTPGHLNPICPNSESTLKDRFVVEVNTGASSQDGYVYLSMLFGLLPLQLVYDTTYNPTRHDGMAFNRHVAYGFHLMRWMDLKFEEYH
jgi:hypothetical protein